ncbi:MAG: hypothetical protein WA117_11825 [Verrucomicrobiia bacterium]
MATGTIGDYHWAEYWNETPELFVPDIIRALGRECLVGTRGVNVSWDSGRLQPSKEQVLSGWSIRDGYAVTPPIDERLMEEWPRSCCGFDEWYFFRSPPQRIELSAFCNYEGHISLGDWESVAFQFSLARQLEQTQPEIVIGEGLSVFIISRTRETVEAFLRLAHDP